MSIRIPKPYIHARQPCCIYVVSGPLVIQLFTPHAVGRVQRRPKGAAAFAEGMQAAVGQGDRSILFEHACLGRLWARLGGSSPARLTLRLLERVTTLHRL